METTLDSCELLAKSLLSTKFQHRPGASVFSDETIDCLRNVCNDYDINRKRKHIGVLSGSATSIFGGTLCIVGTALIPVTAGGSTALIALGIVGAFGGTGVNIGFTCEKNLKDKRREEDISPQLEGNEVQKYIKFENDTATAVALIATAFDMITSLRMCKESISQDILNTVKTKNEEEVNLLLEQEHEEDDVFRNLECILLYSQSLIQRLHMIIDEMIHQGCDNPEIHLYKSGSDHFINIKEEPLTLLLQSLATLCCHYVQGDCIYQTFFIFLKRKFQINDGVAAALKNNRKKFAKQSVPRSVIVMRVVAAMGRVLSPALKFGDDVVKFGQKVANVTRVASITVGIAAGAAGVAIDSVFFVHAAYSLAKGKRDKFFQNLVDVAESMHEINELLKCEDMSANFDDRS